MGLVQIGSVEAAFVETGSVEIRSMKWWVLTAATLCGFFGALLASVETLPQSAPRAPQTQGDAAPAKPPAQHTVEKGAANASKPSSKPHPGTTQTHKATAIKKPAPGTAAHHTASTAHKRRTISPRVARMRQAFVASASLRPMAQQLLQ